MARGWESKAIESQQDDARRLKPVGRVLSAEERAKADRRRTLELARARAAGDLASASHPAHRATLEQAISAIDDQLRAL